MKKNIKLKLGTHKIFQSHEQVKNVLIVATHVSNSDATSFIQIPPYISCKGHSSGSKCYLGHGQHPLKVHQKINFTKR